MNKKSHKQGVGDADKVPAESDSELFRRQMSGTRPIEYETPVPVPRRVVPRASQRRQDEQEVLQESLAGDIDETESSSGESLSFCRPHVGRRTLRRLARGSYSVQAECDLHGMTVAEAAAALRQFVDDCSDRGLTCVRVIHGKGLGSGAKGPILKSKVNAWLRRWEEVLAFVSARQVDGGTGAVHVLLGN